MAKPNYSYEKRQKELAKKAKKEEKLKRKLGKPEGASAEGGEAPRKRVAGLLHGPYDVNVFD
jgi:hypothetical protein